MYLLVFVLLFHLCVCVIVLHHLIFFVFTPVSFFFQACNESVTSVQGGVVGNTGYDEIVASTYTGKTVHRFLMNSIIVLSKLLSSS